MSPMKDSRKKSLKLFLVIMTLATGPIIYLIYSCFSIAFPDFALGLAAERKTISGLVAGFAFTMLGFLAAIVTILFAFTQTNTFKRFKRNGYLELFFFLYIFTIVNLVATAFLALAGFSHEAFIWLFRILLMSFANNIFQVGALAIIISNLAYRASHEN